MHVTLHDNPDTFLAALRQTSSLCGDSNDFMLSLAYQIKAHPASYPDPMLATVEVGARPVLAALMTPPWPAVLAADTVDPGPVCEALIDDLVIRSIPVPGVNAPTPLSHTFADLWHRKTFQPATVRMSMTLYMLRREPRETSGSGRLVQAQPSHRDLLLQWARDFHRDVHLDQDAATVDSHIDYVLRTHNAFLWEDPEPVCMAFRERPYVGGVAIGYVYTPPSHRRCGYASACVTALSRRCFSDGFPHCSLFADASNPTTNRMYRSIGFEPASDFTLYAFGKAADRSSQAPP